MIYYNITIVKNFMSVLMGQTASLGLARAWANVLAQKGYSPYIEEGWTFIPNPPEWFRE